MSTPTEELSGVGEVMAAPVAPPHGPIDQPEGSPVVVVLQHFWDSPSVKAAWKAVLGACVLALGVVAMAVVSANGDLWTIKWDEVIHAAVAAGAFSIGVGFMTWMKTRDNNPTNAPGKK